MSGNNKFTSPLFVGAFTVVAILGFVFGPAGQAIAAKFGGNRDSRIITDEQLSLIVNFIGAGTFLLIIMHHFLEVGRKKVHSTMG
ncbi:UNVERIFIED_CONTAM: hypothetical protein HDU68_012432 [Siphonaria sp. JEL0065]|nr:hypothetical protein HDU68_012432 [Siphonaria sp. JEL0065]